MKLPEIVIHQQVLQYLQLPLKTTCTKTSSALTGPIPAVVPAQITTARARSISEYDEDANPREDAYATTNCDTSKHSNSGKDTWPSFLKNPPTIYKDFGNGLCFCNTNLPSDNCACPSDFIMGNESVFEKDLLSEEILLEFLQDLETSENQSSGDLDIEMVDLGDLSEFLDHLAKE